MVADIDMKKVLNIVENLIRRCVQRVEINF